MHTLVWRRRIVGACLIGAIASYVEIRVSSLSRTNGVLAQRVDDLERVIGPFQIRPSPPRPSRRQLVRTPILEQLEELRGP